MTRQDIERIMQAQGYRCVIREYIGRKGIARDKLYARTRERRPRYRTFGNLEDVMKLDQDRFAQLVREKFAGV